MDERHYWLAQRFQEHRPHLRAVAYRMLGSHAEADAVQEAWIRLCRSNASEIDNLKAWLLTVVGRVALNMLRSRKSRREQPLLDAQHLPDPIVVDRAEEGIDDPEHEALLSDSVGLALLIMLETLTPQSGSPTCCTTCSQSPSRRSPRSWSARPRWRASSPVAPAAASVAPPPSQTLT